MTICAGAVAAIYLLGACERNKEGDLQHADPYGLYPPPADQNHHDDRHGGGSGSGSSSG